MFTPHPYRQDILAEMHARPVVLIPTTCRLRRLVFIPRPNGPGLGQVFERLQNWCTEKNLPAPDEKMRQHSYEAGDYGVTWEQHTEFVTLTWSAGLQDKNPAPEGIGLTIVDGLDLVCAARIDIIDNKTIPQRLLPGFNLPSLRHVFVEDGKGQVMTDFVEDKDGFVRFEFAAGSLSDLRRAIVARRLLEMESYSKMALLGLPLVRDAGGELTALEHAIAALIRKLPGIVDLEAAREAMDELNLLSLQVAALSERLNYRIAASQAYGSIVEQRLENLHEQPAVNGSSLNSFVLNRVGPAIRTMVATEKRLLTAADKIERTVLMLNTRNGLELEIQNSEILNNISQTAKSQFRLQKTVEGLSAIAITYYLLGIIGYALTGPLYALHWSKEWTLSLLAPLVFLLVYLASRRFWRKPGE